MSYTIFRKVDFPMNDPQWHAKIQGFLDNLPVVQARPVGGPVIYDGMDEYNRVTKIWSMVIEMVHPDVVAQQKAAIQAQQHHAAAQEMAMRQKAMADYNAAQAAMAAQTTQQVVAQQMAPSNVVPLHSSYVAPPAPPNFAQPQPMPQPNQGMPLDQGKSIDDAVRSAMQTPMPQPHAAPFNGVSPPVA